VQQLNSERAGLASAGADKPECRATGAPSYGCSLHLVTPAVLSPVQGTITGLEKIARKCPVSRDSRSVSRAASVPEDIRYTLETPISSRVPIVVIVLLEEVNID
jgi:hypothetical protein